MKYLSLQRLALFFGFLLVSSGAFSKKSNSIENNRRFFSAIVPVTPPVITSFSPRSALAGEMVVITGDHFNTNPGGTVVYFGATKALISNITTTNLEVVVPKGAIYAPITVVNTEFNLVGQSYYSFKLKSLTPKATIGPSLFEPKVNFTTGHESGYLTVGDLDGDGKLDVVLNNSDAGATSLSVFLNTSTATTTSFQLSASLQMGSDPEGVTVADVNGDGKLDVIAVSYQTNTVSIHLNTSTGGALSFAPGTSLITQNCPFTVMVRDMDGDGRPDIITANKDGNTAQVFLNSGSMGNLTFNSSVVTLSTGNRPYTIAVDDLDGDGKPDIVAAAYGSNQVNVFLNTTTNGNLSFASSVDLAVNTPYHVVVADLDGDDKPEIITGNLGSQSISIFRNISTQGTIAFGTKEDYNIGGTVYAVAVGDINGDDKLDLAVTNYSSSSVHMLLNLSSSGGISLAPNGDIPCGNGPDFVAIADINNDGDNDLLTANYLKDIATDEFTFSVMKAFGQPLPVELNDFKAKFEKTGAVSLSWDTHSEKDNSYFEISRSTDGANFYKLNTVKGKGTTSERSFYSFNDLVPARGNNYYKLAQVDLNGKVTDVGLQVVNVGLSSAQEVLLYPNPAIGEVNAKVNVGLYEKVELLDLNGRVLKSGSLRADTTLASFNIGSLASGIYFIRLKGSHGSISKSFIKK